MPGLTLVRHGQTGWSEAGRHTGVTDIPLTRRGEEQAAAIGQHLANASFDLVLTSPRTRARETARIAELPAPQVDADLVEWDYGDYEGRTTPEISAELGRPWRLFADGVPGGETAAEVAARADAVLARIRPVLDDGGVVALVGHGHQLRVLTARWLGLAAEAGAMFPLAAGSISRLGHEHGVPGIELWNMPG